MSECVSDSIKLTLCLEGPWGVLRLAGVPTPPFYLKTGGFGCYELITTMKFQPNFRFLFIFCWPMRLCPIFNKSQINQMFFKMSFGYAQIICVYFFVFIVRVIHLFWPCPHFFMQLNLLKFHVISIVFISCFIYIVICRFLTEYMYDFGPWKLYCYLSKIFHFCFVYWNVVINIQFNAFNVSKLY